MLYTDLYKLQIYIYEGSIYFIVVIFNVTERISSAFLNSF